MNIFEKIKNIFKINSLSKNNTSIDDKFTRNNDLIVKKLIEYIPAMMITNLSTLLLISVDGIVVGHFIGEEALSSVSVFYPVNLALSVITLLLSIGISTSISTAIGAHNYEKLTYVKNASKFLVGVSFILISVLQIPIVLFLLKSLNMEKDLYDMTLEYGIGIMILSPFGLISTIGVYLLQVLGKVKVLMRLSIMESIINLIFDILFVGVFRMGTIGAGFGTAVAGIIRSIITIIYILKATDLIKTEHNKFRVEDIKGILSVGMPESVYSLMQAFQNYFFIKIVLEAFGTYGGTIKGVCSFCYNITNIFIMGIVASMRPLLGFFEGAKDTSGIKGVMKIGSRLMIIIVSIVTIIIIAFPKVFYYSHGVDDFTSEAIPSLRLYALYFLPQGLNAIHRLYLTIKKDSKFLSISTMFSYLFLPIFAYAFYILFFPSAIWLSSLAVALIVFSLYYTRRIYFEKNSVFDDLEMDEKTKKEILKSKNIDYDKYKKLVDERILYMSVKPEDAIEASRFIRRYAIEKKFSERIANRMSLCMEEMVNYVVSSQKNKDVSNQIIVRFKEDSGVFMMFDDGKNISFDDDKVYQELTIDNYDLLKKISKSYSYQYILNMNYTIFNF